METETEEKADNYREYPICRTCLNVIRSRSYRLQENSGFGDALKISHILRYIVPELYLGLSHSPEICGNCRESLRVAYTFRKLCLETETMIGNYLKNVRCTAQVIDLGAVINYLSKKKVRQTAQKIISEWEDDSSEDLPSTSETPSSKKIPISDLESIKHVVKQLSQKSVKSKEKKDIESTHSTLEASHTEPVKNPTEPVKDNIDPLNVKTVISKGAFPKTDLLKFDAKSGFFLNSAGRKFIIRDEKAFMINDTQDLVVADATKNTKTYTSVNPIDENKKILINKAAIKSNFVKLTKCTDQTHDRNESSESDTFSISDSDSSSVIEFPPISESPPIATSPPIAKFPQIARSFSIADSIIEYPPIEESDSKGESEPTLLMPKLQQILTVCEETGLLKNNEGEFFNLDGTPMNKEQVEAEKNKAIIRGETLFKISNICTVTDDAFEYDGKKDQEEEIPVNLIQKDQKLETTITKQFGNISVKKTSDLQNPVADRMDISVDESLKSPSDDIFLVKNPAHKTYERNFSITKDTSQTGPAPPLIMYSSKQSLTPNPLVNYGSDVQPASVKPKPKTNILNFLMNKSLGLPEMPTIRFNMDSKVLNNNPAKPEARRNYSILSKKAPDLSFHTPTFDSLMNVSPTENLENLVRVKDEPPDFDLDNSLAPDSEDTLSAPDVEELDSWQNIINSLDDSNSNYVDVPDFVKINNVNMLEMEQLHEEHYANNNLSPSNINDSQNMTDNVLTQKMSRNKEEPILKQPINAVTDRALWESLPEKFPYNGKMLVKCGNYYKFEEEKAPKRRKIRMVPVSYSPVTQQPQQQEIVEEHTFPDREICVLFTNYSSDGLYINDHDYLVAPYVRNKLIVHEKKDTYCICFICGFKHRMQNHAKHMKIHSSTCPVCFVDVRTPYMLNLHMKSHAEPCQICLGMVPFVNITKHNKMHYKGYCGKESIFELEDCEDDEEEEENNEDFEEANHLVKTCYVPSCKNTSKNSAKIFVNVPRRNHLNWFKFVGRNTVPVKQNLIWCCEDHFDMKEDFQNWQEYKLLKVKLRIKKGVLPHKFIDTPSIINKDYSQLDDESKKLREENMKRYTRNSDKGVKLDDRIIAEGELLNEPTEEDKWMTERLHTRSLASNKSDPNQSKDQPSTDSSSNAKPESDETIQKSNIITESNDSVQRPPATRGRKSLRTRKEKTPNKKKKHEDSSDNITPTNKSCIAKTETDEMTDTNQTFSEETKNLSFEKSTENSEVQKAENENKPAKEKSRKVRKRASREIECPSEAELSSKRVLRTRVKKSNIVNENESDR
ncbi:unnamed protein product [Psylliodes chrysocephalus]|uniref:Uncharacterized protein n=1 Tax=Psylliodes chrysocephalus TaxID=3402493 RepID=A0A9P0DBH2_9CUCU|nr:unnamed protein product [Psylliodes chrysocephala]